jgi:hypothetical protein
MFFACVFVISCEHTEETPKGPSAILRRISGLSGPEGIAIDSSIIRDGDTVATIRGEKAHLHYGRNDVIHIRGNSAITVRFHRDNRGDGWVIQTDILYGEVIPLVSGSKNRRMRPAGTLNYDR